MMTKSLMVWLLCAFSVLAQAKTPDGKHFTGRKPLPPATLKNLADAAKQRHGNLIQRLPQATADNFDSRKLGAIPPVRDQGQCGSCWCFSGTGMVTVALISAGQLPNSANGCSEQYSLDCGQNGGCNGDDNVTILQWAKATGLPLDSAYGQYYASSRRCSYSSSMQLYKIQDYGFCSNGGNGVANIQDIKNALVAYKCVGCAIDAGVLGDGTQPITGSGHSIDHDVIIVGWVDNSAAPAAGLPASPTGTWWIMRNSWSNSWGQKCGGTEGGYCYIAAGSGDIGTEAVWCVAQQSKPPNPWVFSVGLDNTPKAPCCISPSAVPVHMHYDTQTWWWDHPADRVWRYVDQTGRWEWKTGQQWRGVSQPQSYAPSFGFRMAGRC